MPVITKYIIFFIIVTMFMHLSSLNIKLHVALLCSFVSLSLDNRMRDRLRYLVVVKKAGNLQLIIVEIFHDCFKICLVNFWSYNFSYTLMQNMNCFILLERQWTEVITTYHRYGTMTHFWTNINMTPGLLF